MWRKIRNIYISVSKILDKMAHKDQLPEGQAIILLIVLIIFLSIFAIVVENIKGK